MPGSTGAGDRHTTSPPNGRGARRGPAPSRYPSPPPADRRGSYRGDRVVRGGIDRRAERRARGVEVVEHAHTAVACLLVGGRDPAQLRGGLGDVGRQGEHLPARDIGPAGLRGEYLLEAPGVGRQRGGRGLVRALRLIDRRHRTRPAQLQLIDIRLVGLERGSHAVIAIEHLVELPRQLADRALERVSGAARPHRLSGRRGESAGGEGGTASGVDEAPDQRRERRVVDRHQLGGTWIGARIDGHGDQYRSGRGPRLWPGVSTERYRREADQCGEASRRA